MTALSRRTLESDLHGVQHVAARAIEQSRHLVERSTVLRQAAERVLSRSRRLSADAATRETLGDATDSTRHPGIDSLLGEPSLAARVKASLTDPGQRRSTASAPERLGDRIFDAQVADALDPEREDTVGGRSSRRPSRCG